MDKLHHILAGFKAQYTEEMMAGVEIARKSCGGAGYQTSSGFTALMGNCNPFPIFEGDNIVMLSQASRYVLKLVKWS